MSKKRRIKKIALAHTALAITLFIIYITLSVTYSPEFFFSDIKNKFSALAINTVNITAKVLAPPVKPVVSISGVCNSGIFKIRLAWLVDENSTSFDIQRNGLPLATGIPLNIYKDIYTEANKSYTYVVVARGPMGSGFSSSDPISITSTDCGTNTNQPIITLPPQKPNETIYTVPKNTRPLFSGNTSIPYAILNIEVHSTQIIYAQIQANANGYWSWTPSVDISEGEHVLYVKAHDPLDLSEVISDQLPFAIVSASGMESSNSESSKDKTTKQSQKILNSLLETIPTTSTQETGSAKIPLAYDVNLRQDSFQQGEDIKILISIKLVEKKYENSTAEIEYIIFDQRGNIIFTEKNPFMLLSEKNIEKNIPLPNYLKNGAYALKTIMTFDSFVIEHEHSFQITPSPFLNLGGNIVITYPDFLSTMGTISIIFMLLLFIWIFFFYREYWLYVHSARHITEKTLEKFGLISIKKRKGASK